MHPRPIAEADREGLRAFLAEHWGAEFMVVRGRVYYPAQLPGFLTEEDGRLTGLITYEIAGDACEIVSLDSVAENRGIGSALIEMVRQASVDAGCRRLWLITTNDNLHALRFYQRRGFVLAALYPDAVSAARLIKPEISLLGNDGIPIRDEIELEMLLPGAGEA